MMTFLFHRRSRAFETDMYSEQQLSNVNVDKTKT